MSDKLLRGQYQVSAQTPMPVDPMDSSSLGSTYSEGTVQLYYYNAGVRTIDAGQAAGTVVDGVFTYRNILDSLGVAIGCKDNTSLAFTCLAMTAEVDPSAHPQLMQVMEGNDTSTPAEKAAAIGAFLSNGQYVVDYRKGMVWVKKATTAATMTGVSYKISSASATTSSAITSVVPGTGATNLGKAEDAAHTSGDVGVMMLAVRNDAGGALAGATGDYIPLTTTSSGDLRVAIGSGGSAGGGNNTYSTEQGDFTATPTDATNDIVLNVDSIGGVALAENNFANGILKVYQASTKKIKTITLDDFTWTSATKTLNTANCAGAFTFATGDLVSLTIPGPRIQDDRSSDAKKSVEQNPVYNRHVGDTLAALTNIATNTTGYLYLSTDGYKFGGFQCVTSGTTPTDTLTLTLEGTMQDDGTADSSCNYDDITSIYTGSASFTDQDLMIILDQALPFKYLRLKYVTSNGGGNDADLTVYARRTY